MLLLYLISPELQASGAYVSGQVRSGSAVVTTSPRSQRLKIKMSYWVGQKVGESHGSELWGQSNIAGTVHPLGTSPGGRCVWGGEGTMLRKSLRAPGGSAISLRASSH